MYCLWGLPGSVGKGQPPPVFCLGLPSMSYKVIGKWLLLMLEVSKRGQVVNESQLLLVLGLGPLSESYGAC